MTADEIYLRWLAAESPEARALLAFDYSVHVEGGGSRATFPREGGDVVVVDAIDFGLVAYRINGYRGICIPEMAPRPVREVAL